MIESTEEWLKTTKRKCNRFQLHQQQRNSYYYDPIARKRRGKRIRRSRIADSSSNPAVSLAQTVEQFPKPPEYLSTAESPPPPTPVPPFSPPFYCDCESRENFSQNIRFSKKRNGRNSSLFCWFLFLIICLCCSADPFVEVASSPPAEIPTTNKTGICPGLDIRNSAEFLNNLKNCRVIEGFLQIVLMDRTNESDFADLSFPELREITGYLLLYRINGLRSLSKLFPNLSVIRGHSLFINYALCVYEMPHLQELGLYSLTDIARGAVFIVKNPLLCYIDTVDWDRIVISGKDINFFSENRHINACPKCPTFNKTNCATSNITKQSFCWNFENCQKGCSGCPHNRCAENGKCCHDYCLGGCTGFGENKCFACKNMFLEDTNRCVAQCPDQYLKFKDYRCIRTVDCYNKNMTKPNEGPSSQGSHISWKSFKGSCVHECPSNYEEVKFTKDGITGYKCETCKGSCRKNCKSVKVNSIQSAQQLKGCVVLNGSLEIQIKGGGNIVKELEDNLNMIEEITGYLKVTRSLPLVSLSFLRRLRVIKGEPLESEKYGLVVWDNQNLEELWDFKSKETNLTIKGRIFFHFNSKLCLKKIKELENMIGLNSTEMEVAHNSNGDKVACNITDLKVSVSSISPYSCNLTWFPYHHYEMRTLLGYVIYFMEAPHRNVSINDGRDACGGDDWNVIDVEISEEKDAQSTPRNMSKIIEYLKPHTLYAYYIKTSTITSETNGGQSKIDYFKTPPTTSTPPRQLKVTAISSNSILIEWQAPVSPNGNLTEYIISVNISNLAEMGINYCDKRIEREKAYTLKEKVKKTTATPEEKCSCHLGEDQPKAKKNDQQVQGIIEFENKLHDTIYIKNPRQKRGTPRFIKKETEVGKISSATTLQFFSADPDLGKTFEPTTATYQSSMNKVSTVTNNDGEYHVPSNKFNFTVNNLKHFSEYKVSIRACHKTIKQEVFNYSPCSSDSVEFVRTFPLGIDEADRIDPKTVDIKVMNDTSYSIVKLKWGEPNITNGRIVSYEIRYQRRDVEHELPSQECINGTQFRKNNNTYTLKIKYSGNYSISLAAISFAAYSHEIDPKWTRDFYFFINEPNSGTAPYFLVAVIIILVLFIIILALLWRYHYADKWNYPNNIPTWVNPEYFKAMEGYEEWKISEENVQLGKLLGIGHFGKVYEGLMEDPTQKGVITKVAIKTLNKPPNNRSWNNCLNEAKIMKEFDTHHVVRLLGVVWKEGPLVIMELMAKGDLRTYLISCRSQDERTQPVRTPPTLEEILQMAAEIADGMLYLSDKKFVHRDLAARNCMINEEGTVKIGDFGLTRDIYDTDYYRKDSKGHLPIRWMAPESLRDGIFTTRSDVWSYGVVLWEMATLAELPYAGLSNGEVMSHVISGEVLNEPEGCPPILTEMMKSCWKDKFSERPKFSDILEILLPHLKSKFASVSYYHSEEAAKLRASHGGSTNDDGSERAKDEQHESQEHHNSGDESQPLTASNANLDGIAARIDAASAPSSRTSVRERPATANGYINRKALLMNDLKGTFSS